MLVLIFFLYYNLPNGKGQHRLATSATELHTRNHNQQYTQKLNIQQHSIYNITLANIHKLSFFPTDI